MLKISAKKKKKENKSCCNARSKNHDEIFFTNDFIPRFGFILPRIYKITCPRFIYKSISLCCFFFSPSPYSRIFYRVNSFADTFIFRFDGPPFIDKYSIPEAANWFSVRHPPRFSFFQTHAGKIPKRLTTTKTRKGLRHFRDIDWSVIRDRKFSTLHVDRKKNRVYDEMDVFLFEIYIVLSCNEKMSEFSYN